MSLVDQKRALNKLKHDLEGRRELIVLMNSVLKWDNKFYPGIIFGTVSLIFLSLWLLDLSTLTILSLGGLLLISFDYGYRVFARLLWKSEEWTGAMENKFEETCSEICSMKIKLSSWYEYIFTAKEENSMMFVILVTACLLLLAWIGAVVDNLFLCYIGCLFLVMYPGLQRHGFIETVKERIGGTMLFKLPQCKDMQTKTE